MFLSNQLHRSLNRFYFAKMAVRDALNSAMADEIARDPTVFLMGEEVAHYQGAYKVSKGLFDKFGSNRIWDTPITEAGFSGLGVGAALYGLKPIVEFMTFNFAMQAIDHIVNSAAKARYMSGGDLSCPIVFRGINGPAAAVGAQHSQCYASWYSNVPGLVVVAPYDIEDCRGLLKSSIRDSNPVVFLENEILYGTMMEYDEKVMDKEFLVPLGKAKVMREGSDITICTFSKMVQYSMEAAQKLESEGVSVEVINLRTLRPLDRETIVKSVKKTKRLVAVEEGWSQNGIAAELCALMMESEAFFHLDAPVERISGWDIPTPYAFNLEEMSFPKTDNIIKGVRKCLNNKI